MRAVWRCTWVLLLCLHPLTGEAQRLADIPAEATRGTSPPSFFAMPAPTAVTPHAIRWWEAASVAGFTLAVMTQDEWTTEEFVEHPTDGARHLASAFRRVGQPEVYAGVPVAVLATGLLAGNDRITRAGGGAGGRLAASVLASTAAFETVKLVSGRSRPDAGEGAYDFSPFSGRGSFPSGHSTVAFALATSLANEIHHPFV